MSAPHPFAIVFAALMAHINGNDVAGVGVSSKDGCRSYRCRRGGADAPAHRAAPDTDPLPGPEAQRRNRWTVPPSQLALTCPWLGVLVLGENAHRRGKRGRR